MNTLRVSTLLRRSALVVLFLLSFAFAQWQKPNPDPSDTTWPPDADKLTTGSDRTCWLATAANMLAGAGYGTGSSVQARANDIYGLLKDHYSRAAPGW